jgi:hypothetical protein
MISTQSLVPFGTNPNVIQGYCTTTNDRLGNVDITFENVGTNTAYITLKEFVRVAGVSTAGIPNGGYTATASDVHGNVLTGITVAPSGVETISLVSLSNKIGFFGSGNTVVNITPNFRNPANLRGASLDVVPIGRQGWGFEASMDTTSFTGNIQTKDQLLD